MKSYALRESCQSLSFSKESKCISQVNLRWVVLQKSNFERDILPSRAIILDVDKSRKRFDDWYAAENRTLLLQLRKMFIHAQKPWHSFFRYHSRLTILCLVSFFIFLFLIFMHSQENPGDSSIY